MNHPEVSSTSHPSDETLAAFVDGRVDAETRKLVIEHIATCDDCRADWQAISEFAEAEETSSNAMNVVFPRGRWYGLIAAAAAITMGFVLWPFVETWRNRDALQEAIASREERPTLARLSGEHEHRSVVPTLRNGEQEEPSFDPRFAEIYRAADAIDRATARRRNAENLRQYANAYLLQDKWREALQLIDEALLRDTGASNVPQAIARSDNAPLLNDVAAIYYAHATRRSADDAELKIARDAAHRAWMLSQARESLWNYAAALEALEMKDEARKAWTEYRQIDPNSKWSEEAKGRLAELDAPSF